MPDVRVGCAGWNHEDWVGPVYAPSTPPREWLKAYVGWFPIVEVESTFHALPPASAVADWIERAQGASRFAFTALAPEAATHEYLGAGNLDAARALLTDFLDRVVRPLEEANRFEAVLLELPPTFDAFQRVGAHDPIDALEALALSLEPRRRRVAVEFRHRSWYDHVGERLPGEVQETLSARGIGVVQADGLGSRFTSSRTTPWTYFRLHGRRRDVPPAERDQPRAAYNYLYDASEVREIAAAVQARAAHDERTLVIFNNPQGGRAAKNALDLLGALGLPRPAVSITLTQDKRLDDFQPPL